MTKFYREGYPRPQMVRGEFVDLNGEWEFRFDEEREGIAKGWQDGFEDRKIRVPFAYESAASGIGDGKAREVMWYSRRAALPLGEGRRLLLHFEGVDYRAMVWVNGVYVGCHDGGYTRFTFDITEAVRGRARPEEESVIVCRAEDSCCAAQPRGKQRWLAESYDCWYTQTTGIWKSVWAEETGDTYIKQVDLTPLYDDNAVEIAYELEGPAEGMELETTVTFGERTICSVRERVTRSSGRKRLSLLDDSFKWKVKYWHPDHPNLYDVAFRLYDAGGDVEDEVGSYFGLRKISTDTGRIQLNNQDYYLKMVLDQGYWKESLLTPPDEEAIKRDLRKTLEYGYNGVRKHQKIEDERYYYWADVLGVLVWCEMPSCYEFNTLAVEAVTKEWTAVVKQHYSHPSIITWVPFNESWGLPRIRCDGKQQEFTEAIYHLTKALDQTRPVISNDGWEHTTSDIITLHDYARVGEALLENWKHREDNLTGRRSFNGERYAFADGYGYRGQPVIISEFGGIAYQNEKGGWGYGDAEESEERFLERLQSLIDALGCMDFVCGYCYTQLTDVEQEQNGHMDMARNEKIGAEKIRRIIGGEK